MEPSESVIAHPTLSTAQDRVVISDTIKLYIKEEMEKEISRSNTSYAIKLVEKIVFGMVGFILLAVLAAVVREKTFRRR